MDPQPGDRQTRVEGLADRELAATRLFDAPPGRVFDAWTKPELFKLWWAPKSMGVPLQACEQDVRVGGHYAVTFGKDADNTTTFFGRYLEVEPPHRLVWTNDESAEAPVTTVTFEDESGRTRLTLHERYPSKAARDETLAGMRGVTAEQFLQLDELLARQAAQR